MPTPRLTEPNISVDSVVANAVIELKSLVQTQMQGATHPGSSSAPLTIVERLAYRIDEIRHAQARACVVWLVGQYAADDSPNAVVEGVVPWAPDVLRKIAKSFRDEVRDHRLFISAPLSRAR
jgi:AP-3 complex subunit beta